MNRVRAAIVAVLVGVLLMGGSGVRAFADISNSTGTNVQGGDNRGNTHQGGKSGSGDAVGGQVTGVVSAGRTSVDANNVSKDSSVTSGDAHGTNTSNSFVGLSQTTSDKTLIGSTTDLSFITLGARGNLQDGGNRQTLTQTSNATTGDGVAGEVIGAVTAAGGSVSVVAANTTSNSDVITGDARSTNDSNAFVGLSGASDEIGVGGSDISNVTANGPASIEEGSNRQTLSQSATTTTGDGVAGQIIGAVSSGATSIDARNSSDNVSVQTGDSVSSNGSRSFIGLADSGESIEVTGADITNVTTNSFLDLQQGDNRQTGRQTASASSGDGVAGEIIGAVTSAGGSTSIVAANNSKNSDVTTGDARSTNDSNTFVGLSNADDEVEVGAGDISGVTINGTHEANVLEGSNRQTLSQASASSTGDGVAGQVIGAVSAGRTSIDANNSSDNVSATTGDARSENSSNAIVGLAQPNDNSLDVGTSDISGVTDGDNLNVEQGNNAQTLSQSSKATTGDATAGEVIGVVTSAGGSTSVVAANTSKTTDVTTGDASATNASDAFVGLALAEERIDLADVSNVSGCTQPDGPEVCNVQDGSNRQTLTQTSSAATGDGVGGQVLGVVSAGATSLDAANHTADSTATTGDSNAANDSGSFVGLAGTDASGNGVSIGDVTAVTAGNVQDGSNRQTLAQSADATSGDAVAGQVLAGVTAGVITGAGGSASIVVDNTSTSIDSTTGDTRFANDSSAFVGLLVTPSPVTVGPLA